MLAYCLNVHPGTSLEDVKDAVLKKAPRVHEYYRELTGADGDRGIGIWFAADAAREVEPVITEFAKEVADAGLVCRTFNGFPYGQFHGTRVKETVYLPDWRSKERVEHTVRLARLLTHFLPENGVGSISTVPVGYRLEIDESGLAAACENLADCVRQLHEIREATGKTIQLALEPEPDCVLDSLASVLELFSNAVNGPVLDNLTSSHGALGGTILNRHLGVCLDLTHVAVEFEDPVETLEALLAANIPVFKIQVGSALIRKDLNRDLSEFADEVYLHQTRINGADGETVRYPDLPEALDKGGAGEWRIHYHVPLVWEGDDTLHSSRELVSSQFFSAARAAGIDMFEVETYTLGLFPDKTEPDEKILARELVWVAKRLG